ncbi:MAG TPA: glycosyltransferase [Thermoanaerobaculia bacterium]|jgi:glycosyltransferase involved in cell wall biosynthesis|nr:glycosyltransferase [Thermoanaerobaculia bacterium]
MKLAILGTRGVPPAYGGFETFAAELGTRLVARGHEVTVYCRGERRAGSPAGPWYGIERIVLPALNHKYFETVSHTFLSALDALRRDFDVVLMCNAANAFTLPLLRAARMPVAINVDGIERKRRKWNALGRAVYAIGESFSVVFADQVVADADVIADYYRARYSIEPVMIPYGAGFPAEDDTDVLERLGIRGYILYVSRFEPENNPLEVVQAYEKLTDAPPLVMLGSGLYAPELVAELHRHAGPRILFPGALYGADYRTLQRNAFLYIQATEVGGTHPAMIEAMASNGAVLAHDTPENREVGGDAVGYFRLRPEETLSGMLREWLRSVPDRERARQRAAERFSWDAVTDRYEELLGNLVSS